MTADAETAVRLLDAYDDAEAWHALLERLPERQRDVYFYPAYVRLHLFEPGARALLFVYEEGDAVWAKPLILQPIPERYRAGAGLYDLDAVYGYGGPLCSAPKPDFLQAAHEAFAAWCREQGVVSEFVRYHPFLGNEAWDAEEVEVLVDRKTVSTEIAEPDEMMAAFSGNTRNMIRKSGRLDVRIEAVDPAEAMPQFRAMYEQNMDYVEADPYYYFTPAYFKGLSDLVRERGFMLVARHEEDTLAGSLFLSGSRFLHYHLSAADYSKRKTGTTNAILFDALRRGHEAGLERLHLGGGTTNAEDDSLFKFKDSMGTDHHTFYIGKRVHQPEAYAQLKEVWQEAYPEAVKRYGNRVLCYRYRDNA